MRRQKHSDVTATARQTVVCAGRFRPNAGSAVDNTLNKGKGFTATWTGVGTFRITFEDIFAEVTSFVPSIWRTAGVTGVSLVEVVAIGSTTDSEPLTYVDIRVMTNAAGTFAAANIASDAGSWISFVACLRGTDGV